MKITDLLKANQITLGAEPKSKSEAIEMLISLQNKSGALADRAAYLDAILEREKLGTTAIGEGIAVPHAKSDSVKAPSLAAITVKGGVDYDAPDGKPSDLLFMIAAPVDGDLHLEILSRLMVMLMEKDFADSLRNAKSAEEFRELIDKKEAEKYPEEASTVPAKKSDGYRILAVTACPTGIAHTYLAAEALEQAGEKLGIPLKAETNGSGGSKNVLTKKEIAEADGIIIAADKSVEMSRFDGKKLISVSVSDGIKRPEELINTIVNGNAPVYHHSGTKAEDVSDLNESLGRKMYKHLMNGVSHMLPFVVAGGIFIALAFLFDTIAGAPQDGNFGTATALSAWFKTIGGYAFGVMVPILSGFIAMSIADRPGLLVGFVGGYLATSGATFASPGGDVPSGFLGALLAGFLGGYLIKLVEKACDKLPKALEGIKPVLIYPLAGLGIVGVMMCAVNPIMGWLNTELSAGLTWLGENDLMILLGAIVAGMMAIDMGGPFNKAAYVFGTGMLTQAATMANPNVAYEIMAAVMIGGMVPPIAIALSTTFFKKKWTEQERKNGPVNYIMGLSFITEGAIPYAASHPLIVIPSCIVGSAVAGALSTLFKCTLMAPHGGIFVFAVVGNWAMYLLSLAVGSIVGMLMLAILKRNIKSTGEQK